MTTIPQALSRWARQRPDTTAFEMVRTRRSDSTRISFRQLERTARQIAAVLHSTVGAGARVLLVLPPGTDYISAFLGCLYAGAVAVPLSPPRPGASGERIRAVARSSRPSLVLCTAATAQPLRGILSSDEPAAPAVQPIETVLATPADEIAEIPVSTADTAFLQYTSGSTGQPRGVMVSHRNLAENQRAIATGFGIKDDDVVLSWLPLYHDMGLIGTTLLPLRLGLTTVLLDTFEFIHDPLCWAVAISRFGATCSGGPDFAYQLMIDRYDTDRLTGVDLTNWRIAFSGAEPVQHTTLNEFTARYERHGFDRAAWFPCYGLAESTLFVSGVAGCRTVAFDRHAVQQRRLVPVPATTPATTTAPRSDPAPAEPVVLVSCGAVAEGSTVVIRDEAGTASPDGVIGEICVQGPSVARGYWDDPDATAQTFDARICGHPGTFLRTGDLGARWEKQLYLVGRTKDLIIVAGRNFYPADLVAVGSRVHPGLRRGAATAFELDGQRVVLVLEVVRSAVPGLRADPEARTVLGAAVHRAVAVECELDLAEVVLVFPGSLPRTSSGKIRTAQARARWLDGRLTVVGRFSPGRPAGTGTAEPPPAEPLPAGQRTAAVREVLEQAVRRRTGPALRPTDLGRPLAALGMDSLMLAALRGAVEQRLGYQVDAELFVGDRSIDEVADVLGAAPDHPPPPQPTGPPAARPAVIGDEVAPAADGQVQQQFYAELFAEDTAHNLPWALHFSTRFAEPQLRAAVGTVVVRHPALRTTLGALGSNSQLVHARLEPPWQVRTLDREDLAEALRFFAEVTHQRFDLVRGPLIRAAAVLAPQSTMLLIVCHHAVVDHWSLEILQADLCTALAGDVLAPGPEPDVTATAWARAQHELASTDPVRQRLAALAAQWRPWRNEVLFPATSRPGRAAGRGRRRNPAGVVDIEIGAATTRDLYRRGRRTGRTPFVTVAAAYLHALHRVTGRRRVVIGTPYHGRSDWRFATTVGYFVTMLPLLGEFPTAQRDPDRLEQAVWRELRTALAGAVVPFSRLVNALAPDRHGQHPLFQATLTFQQSARERGAPIVWGAGARPAPGSPMPGVPGVLVTSLDIPPRDAAFALGLYGARDRDRMPFRLVYQRELLDADTAQLVCEEFRTSLAELVTVPGSV